MSDEDEEYVESVALLDKSNIHGVPKVEPFLTTGSGGDGEETSESKGIVLPRPQAEKLNASRLSQCRTAVRSCFQPPVIGSVAGIVFVSFPWLRGLFVDLENRDNGAPLQFLFDGLYAVGQSAVPINMMILGCNLSSSASFWKSRPAPSKAQPGFLSMRSMVGVVIGKMIVIPFIGILSAWILKTYFWNIPKEIEGAFYLVLMIVFLTPTANNVMVMVELSGSGAKEGMANVIALQYLVAPIILSCTMTIAIGVTSGWTV
jgi:auxin efflux carrier family protein